MTDDTLQPMTLVSMRERAASGAGHEAGSQALGTPNLSHDDLLFIIEMFARGYTVRHVIRALTKRFGQVPPDQFVMRLAVDYCDDIERARAELAQVALERGLAAKHERVLRLNELAESWEERAQLDGKAAGVYMRALEQIQREVEPLGLTIVIPRSDPWAQLLTDLKSRVTANSTNSDSNSDQTS